jgi:hypothetical protein
VQLGDYSQSTGWAFIEFPYVHVFPPVLDPYASLTLAKLATFGIGPAHDPDDDNDDDDEEANDDEEAEDDE